MWKRFAILSPLPWQVTYGQVCNNLLCTKKNKMKTVYDGENDKMLSLKKIVVGRDINMNWTSAVLLQLSAILWTAASFSTYNFVGGGSGRLSSGAQKHTRYEYRSSSCYSSAISSSSTLGSTEYDIKAACSTTADTTNISILPARQPLPSSSSVDCKSFSLLSWNVLLPNSKDNWWCHKQYSSNTPMSARQWSHRHSLIKDRILQSNADIVCIQEADGETFDKDFEFMILAGYDHVYRSIKVSCTSLHAAYNLPCFCFSFHCC